MSTGTPATVHLVLHRHHFDEDTTAEAPVTGGEPLVWDDGEDCVKVVGLYSTRAAAEDRVAALRTAPGFRLAPDGFAVHAYTVDTPRWPAGFRTGGD